MSAGALYILYGVLAVGAVGLYLLMPSTSEGARRLRRSGAILALAALAVLFIYGLRWIGAGFEGRWFFVVFAAIGIMAAVRVITHQRPVYSAVYFILVVLATTGLAILVTAEFLAIALVIIYGGAILVTYIFVIMLAQQKKESLYDRQAREPWIAVLLGFVLVAAVTQALVRPTMIETREAGGISAGQSIKEMGKVTQPPMTQTKGNIQAMGEVLMTRYAVAVEVAGVLLLVAMIGAIAISQKRIGVEDLTRSERNRREEPLGRTGREAPPF